MVIVWLGVVPPTGAKKLSACGETWIEFRGAVGAIALQAIVQLVDYKDRPVVLDSYAGWQVKNGIRCWAAISKEPRRPSTRYSVDVPICDPANTVVVRVGNHQTSIGEKLPHPTDSQGMSIRPVRLP